MNTKTCSVCGVAKERDAFRPRRAQCLECYGLLMTQRLLRLNEARKNDGFRAQRRAYLATIRTSPAYRARERRHRLKYAAAHPDREAAKRAVRGAILRGELARPEACEQCGRSPRGRDNRTLVQAHHDDYSKPLDVRWLCHMCHSKEHRALAADRERPKQESKPNEQSSVADAKEEG